MLGAAVIAGPVFVAVTELLHALLIAAIALLGLGAAGLVAVVAYRLGRRRQGNRPG